MAGIDDREHHKTAGVPTTGRPSIYDLRQPELVGVPVASIARLRTVVIDCPDPAALAEFHRLLVGGEITSDAGGWVVLETEPGHRPAFQQADEYAPPDLADIRAAAAAPPRRDDRRHRRGRACGAGDRGEKHEIQPGEADGDSFRVYLDPAGHPFCLCCD